MMKLPTLHVSLCILSFCFYHFVFFINFLIDLHQVVVDHFLPGTVSSSNGNCAMRNEVPLRLCFMLLSESIVASDLLTAWVFGLCVADHVVSPACLLHVQTIRRCSRVRTHARRVVPSNQLHSVYMERTNAIWNMQNTATKWMYAASAIG